MLFGCSSSRRHQHSRHARMRSTHVQLYRLVIGGQLSLAAALGIGRFIYTPILPRMAEDLGLSKGEAGLIASANYAGYLAGALLVAGLNARAGGRAWLLGSLAASALSTAAMALPTELLPMLVLRFVGGAASALVMVFASTLVLERLALAGRGNLSTLHFAGVGVGIAASAALVAVLAFSGIGWRGLWLSGGALALLALPFVNLLLPAEHADRVASKGNDPSPAGKSAALTRLVIAYGLFGLGYVVTATFIVAIVRGDAGMRALEPVVWILVGLAAVPSVSIWTRLSLRWGLLRAYAAACFAEAIGVAASALMPNIAGAAMAAILLGGTFVAITALGLVAARQMSPANPRRAMALMTAAFGVGQIAGPVAAGWAYDLLGSFAWPSLAAALGLLLGAALTFRIDRRS